MGVLPHFVEQGLSRPVLGGVRGSGILLSEPLDGHVEDVITAVRSLSLESLVAKRRDSRYIPGERSDAWQKLKLDRQQEFVVGGYRPGSNGLHALLVGYYKKGQLRFAGKVRAGFTPHVWRQVFAPLEPLHSARAVPLSISRTAKPRIGAAASRRNRWRGCAGSSPTSWRRSASWNGRPTGTCAMRRSWHCGRTSGASEVRWDK